MTSQTGLRGSGPEKKVGIEGVAWAPLVALLMEVTGMEDPGWDKDRLRPAWSDPGTVPDHWARFAAAARGKPRKGCLSWLLATCLRLGAEEMRSGD